MDEYSENFSAKKPEENMRKHRSYTFNTKQSPFSVTKKIDFAQSFEMVDEEFFKNIMESQRQSCLTRENLLKTIIHTESGDYKLCKMEEQENYYFDKNQFQTAHNKKKSIFDYYDVPSNGLALQSNFMSIPFVNESESKINMLPESNSNPVTLKQNSGLNLRISCLQNKKILLEKTGYLEKKCSSFFKGWKLKYVSLADKKFLYYSPNNKEKAAILDFDLINVEIEYVEENSFVKEFRLLPKESNKVFRFKSKDNKENLSEWVNTIKSHIASSEGRKNNLTDLAKIKKFWKNEAIPESKFIYKADTLDILLFKSKSVAGKLQRSITGSEYDHVALLLRFGNSDLVILEATENNGVGLIFWKTFMQKNFYELYEKVVFRHLEINRTNQLIENLENITKQVIGKRYEITPFKLLKRVSVIDSKIIQEDRTFFCSELVASIYKYLGLIDLEKSSAQYWPGCFSDKNNIYFENGAKFSKEYLIDFTI